MCSTGASDRPPAHPWRDTLIYELHVKGFTQLHPAVPAEWRGKYLGLTVAPVIEHLKSIGVTAVELLPCQSFMSEQFLLDRKLSNYWGYNSVAWFAPANDYALQDAVAEFKLMVKTPARCGHRSDLGRCVQSHCRRQRGGSAAFPAGHRQLGVLPPRAAGPAPLRKYQRLRQHRQLRAPAGSALIIDCLKYWVEEMHVDGFRFDLATVLGREGNGVQRAQRIFQSVARRALARIRQADRGTLGCGSRRLPARAISAGLGGVERPVSGHDAIVLAARRRQNRRVCREIRRLQRFVSPQRPQADRRHQLPDLA